jgi:hypothetical protein
VAHLYSFFSVPHKEGEGHPRHRENERWATRPVNSPAAYANWFRDDGKGVLANIASTAKKSVDFVAVDLKGASQEQIGAMKAFVKTLAKAERDKVIYVH